MKRHAYLDISAHDICQIFYKSTYTIPDVNINCNMSGSKRCRFHHLNPQKMWKLNGSCKNCTFLNKSCKSNTQISLKLLKKLVNNKQLYPELKLFYTSTACDKYHVCHIIIFYSNFNHNSPLVALQCKLHDGRLQWNDHCPTLDQVFCTPLHQIDLIFPSLRFSPHLNVNPNLKLKCI